MTRCTNVIRFLPSSLSLPSSGFGLVTSKCTSEIPSCLLLVSSTLILQRDPSPGVLTLSLSSPTTRLHHSLGASPTWSLHGVLCLPLLEPVNIVNPFNLVYFSECNFHSHVGIILKDPTWGPCSSVYNTNGIKINYPWSLHETTA